MLWSTQIARLGMGAVVHADIKTKEGCSNPHKYIEKKWMPWSTQISRLGRDVVVHTEIKISEGCRGPHRY